MRAILPLLALLSWIAPPGATACAVCFGAAPGSNLALAIGTGILLLLCITLTLLAALAIAVWRIEKQRLLAEAALFPALQGRDS
ncbi:MAG: hypothetical protein KGO96_03485 [Elusimicrobia bacterium]|nr:hypothetical protein [Elusimicrobiota bacterium]MDE2424955.1 hypothetical protein [Elusimicrobiota bacterium]